MAVLKMDTVKIVGMMPSLDRVVELCANSEVFEPEPAANFFADVTDFNEFNRENPYAVPLQKITETVKGANRKLKTVDISDFTISNEQISLFLERLEEDVSLILESKNLLEDENRRVEKEIEDLSHFKNLSVPIESMFKSEFLKARFGRIPKESYEKLKDYDDNPYVLFFPCEVDEYCWGMYIAPSEHIKEVDRIFSSIYFEKLIIPSSSSTPMQAIEKLNKKIAQNKEALEVYGRRLEEYFNSEYDLCLKIYSYLYEKNTVFELKRYSIVEITEGGNHEIFIYAGFVPHKYSSKLKSMLSKVSGIEVEISPSDRRSQVTVPTYLKNDKFSRPYEFYVNMFGTPNYNEIDPTLFVGITYTLLFGAMFADVGHGLILALAAFIMWKVKNMNLGPILFRCGISSAFFGVIFGSVFGYEDLLDPFYKTLFGWESKPIHILDSDSIIKVLFVPIGVGAGLILLAMILNIVAGIKQRDIEKAVFSNNGLAGIVFYGGIMVAAAGLVLFDKNIVSTPYILIVLVLPIILMMFKEVLSKLITREQNPFPKKWGDYIVQNFFEVFDYLISYVSNTISFMRVGAFVLIHAIMMEVVFVMADMAGGVGAVIIIVIGNIFVLGLEALLVSIQGLRLEFYEMFSRFFKGDGRQFKPVKPIKLSK